LRSKERTDAAIPLAHFGEREKKNIGGFALCSLGGDLRRDALVVQKSCFLFSCCWCPHKLQNEQLFPSSEASLDNLIREKGKVGGALSGVSWVQVCSISSVLHVFSYPMVFSTYA